MGLDNLKQIGPYEVRGVLGKGGMAVVYRGYQPNLNREVAIKVLTTRLEEDRAAQERFKREALAVASLRHPNILIIYDFGQVDDTPYIVSELVKGETLRKYLGKPMEMRLVSQILGQLAGALDYAHEHGIIHRDVKPSNILMDERNRAVLSDFGIAKLVEQDAAVLTATGTGVGTPEYMAPEQGLGEKLDGRTDQYSLGVVLYEMLTGVTPYRGDGQTPLSILMSHAYKPLPDPRQYNPGLSPAVAEVLRKALSKRPSDRFNSSGELARAFDQAIYPPTATLPHLPASTEYEKTMAVSPPLQPNPPTYPTYLNYNQAPPPVQPQTQAPLQQQPLQQPPSQPQPSYQPQPYYAPQTPPPVANNPAYEEEEGEEGSNKGLIIGIISGVLALILLAVAAFIFLSGGNKPTAQVTTAAATATVRPTTTVATTTAAVTTTIAPASATPINNTTTAAATSATTTVATTTAVPTTAARVPVPISNPQVANAINGIFSGLPANTTAMVLLANGQSLEQNSEKKVRSASIIKLWIAATSYDMEASGKLNLGESYTLKAGDVAPGSGILLKPENIGKSYTYAQLIETMLTYSDNTAANIIIDKLGGVATVSDYAKKNNYNQTVLQRKLGTPDPNNDNTTSALDCATFLDTLLKKKIVSATVSDKIIIALKSRRAYEDISSDFFGRFLPDNLDYAHISGILTNVRNDAGFYFNANKEPVIVVILGTELTNEKAGEDAISKGVEAVLKAIP